MNDIVIYNKQYQLSDLFSIKWFNDRPFYHIKQAFKDIVRRKALERYEETGRGSYDFDFNIEGIEGIFRGDYEIQVSERDSCGDGYFTPKEVLTSYEIKITYFEWVDFEDNIISNDFQYEAA